MNKLFKRIFFILFISTFSLNVQAQEVEFGSEQITNAYNNQPVILGISDGFMYVIRVTGYGANIYQGLFKSDNKAMAGMLLVGMARFTNDAPFNNERLYYTQRTRYYFEKYDLQMKLITSKELDVEIKPKGDIFDFIRFAMVGTDLYGFAYEENESTGENILNAFSISKEGVFDKTPRKISSYTTSNKYNKGRKDHSYGVIVSADKSKCLVIHSELEFPKKEEGKKTLSMEMFGQGLNSLWKEEFEVPISERTVTMENVKISNNGDVASLFKIKSDEKDGPDNIYALYTYLTSRKQLDAFSLKMDDKYTNDITFEFAGNKTLEVAGFYSGRNKSSAEGFFYRKINTETGTILKDSEESFSKEFIATAVGEKKADKTDDLKNFHVRKIIPLPDNRIALLAEKYVINYKSNSNSLAASGTYEFNYEDIYVIMLDAEGNYEWGKKILKYQRTYEDGGLYNSFCSISNENEIILIYNANRDDPDERMTNTKKATAYATKVPLDGGKITTKKLFNAKEAETIMAPKIFIQESPNTVILYNISSKYYKYARVKI